MAKQPRWIRNIFHGVVGNALYALLVLLWGGGVTYFSYVTPPMGAALLKGFFASVLLIVATVAIRLWLSLPSRPQPTTPENIEERAKEWLFKYGLSIKNEPSEIAHFRLLIVTPGGAKIYIARAKGTFDESVSFTADLKATPEEVTTSEAMSNEERLRIVYELQLEFSRAKIAYKGLDYIQGFSITRRIPISATLGETEILETLFDVEAVLNAAFVVLNVAALRHRTQTDKVSKVIDGNMA